jgi:CheY-like chemotaxis protein
MIQTVSRNSTASPRALEPATVHNINTCTVLVVEDSELAARLLTQLLTRMGFDVHRARDGKEALRALRRCDYSLVLMDCYMPEMNGWDATLAIRESEKYSGKHVPIIGYSSCADERSCLDAGMDFFLNKPAPPDVLARTIRAWHQI